MQMRAPQKDFRMGSAVLSSYVRIRLDSLAMCGFWQFGSQLIDGETFAQTQSKPNANSKTPGP